MINLFKWLIYGHIHKYEQVDVANLTAEGRCIGKIYFMRCTKCGEMKSFEVHV